MLPAEDAQSLNTSAAVLQGSVNEETEGHKGPASEDGTGSGFRRCCSDRAHSPVSTCR